VRPLAPALSLVALGLVLSVTSLSAYERPDTGSRFGQRIDDQVVKRPQGPGVIMGVIEPRVAKRFVSQELYEEHGWQSWQYTNYAGDRYNRYVDPGLWGDNFYDGYGNLLTRGWLLYEWTEDHPRVSESSSVLKRPEYGGLVGSLIIASDTKGGNSFAITIGDEIFTSLTPMTFRKSVFNGTQMDFSNSRMQLTGVFSRISAPGFITDPNAAAFNAYTNLVGGRALLHLNESLTIGSVFVDAHNGRGTVESFSSDPLKGDLTSSQLERGVSTVIIRLGDDSPADGSGGAVLLADDVEIYTTIGDRDTLIMGSEIGFAPLRSGGTIREGVRTADGVEQIELRYELEQLNALLDDRDAVNSIRDLRFRLVLVNDYRVEVTSNQQTNFEDQPVFLLVAQAPGNVRDGSNKKEVVFNYGLPTATRILGLTLEARDLLGFNFYTEFDLNHNYRKYPSRRVKTHKAYSGTGGDESARAWMMNLTRSSFPWYFSAEGFYLDEDYSTSPYIVDGNGRIDYADPTRSVFDFVDDNDDNDRRPDQERRYQDPRTGVERGNEGRNAEGNADDAVFPGWDQNNDFISDFNQNSNFFRENRFPDYEEAFLRYASDRPEYLFGIDLNNNGWVDQFENDNEPDYPYKRDHKGYNLFVRNHLNQWSQLTVGHVHQWLISDDRENQTSYMVAGLDREYVWGRVRAFDMLKKTADDIQDNLFQWLQEPGLPGGHVSVEDPLFARDTWVNTVWLGYDHMVDWGLNTSHKVKLEKLWQGDGGKAAGMEDARLLGLVNKADYLFRLGRLAIHPKLKSEVLRDNTPYSMGGVIGERKEWTKLAFLTFTLPVLRRTELQWGLEQMLFSDYILDEDELERGDFSRDFRSSVWAAQLTNTSDYQGYRLTTILGYQLRRLTREREQMKDQSQTDSSVFMTIYASLSQ
jgi:hypothetical protein